MPKNIYSSSSSSTWSGPKSRRAPTVSTTHHDLQHGIKTQIPRASRWCAAGIGTKRGLLCEILQKWMERSWGVEEPPGAYGADICCSVRDRSRPPPGIYHHTTAASREEEGEALRLPRPRLDLRPSQAPKTTETSCTMNGWQATSRSTVAAALTQQHAEYQGNGQ